MKKYNKRRIKMNPAVKNQNNSTFKPIQGYNKAVLTELKTESFTAKGKQCIVTKAIFHVVGASEKSYEKMSITNTEDDADLDVCNMIVTAFGGREVKEGDSVDQVLNKCIGKECSILLYPQTNYQGKTYLNCAPYGFFKGHKGVENVSKAGTEVELDLSTPNKKPAKEEPKEDDLPF